VNRLYGRLWRWHFFAGLIVIPFVLWQATTGVLYLWNREIVQLQYPQLVSVPARPGHVGYQAQLDSVLRHEPRDRLQSIEISGEPDRSTIFLFRGDNGLARVAFVDPHDARYLGSLSSWQWIGSASRGLHGGWPIEPWGSYLLELGACWAIVMVLTGLYLWWPRNAQGLAGALYPRLRSGSRIFWRDLHATVGVWFALIVLAFLLTALPWTTFWGKQVLGPVQRATGQESPLERFFAGDHGHAGAPTAAGDAGLVHGHHAAHGAPLDLDALVARARTAGVRGTLEVSPVPGALNVKDRHARSSEEVWLQLDAGTGAVLARVTWDDMPLIPRLVALGIDLHEGTFLGRANQVFNTTVALALVWLSVTGFVGWYRRRPNGGFAAPPRGLATLPGVVVAMGTVACVLLPLLGASVLAVLLADGLLGRHLER
jgi:uncharacterized iron-regulated membrane protein